MKKTTNIINYRKVVDYMQKKKNHSKVTVKYSSTLFHFILKLQELFNTPFHYHILYET